MAERVFLYGAVVIAVVAVGLSQAQAMLHMLGDQSRTQARRFMEISAQIDSLQPALGALLRSPGGDAGLRASRMAQQSSEATAVEILDGEGTRLLADPEPIYLAHWPEPGELDAAQLRVLIVGPFFDGVPRALAYLVWGDGRGRRVMRLSIPVPDLLVQREASRRVFIGQAVALVVLLVALGLAVVPGRGRGGPREASALGAYEEAMSRLQHRGEELSRRHDAELTELRHELEDQQAFARAGQLTAGIAHEVRNGLGTIVGYARLIERSQSPDTTENAAGILAECQTLETVIRRFMEFVRHEQLNVGRFELPRMMRRVVARETRGRPMAEVAVDIDALGEIEGDEELLERAFENLIRNALEAAGQRGHVWIAGARDERWLTVTVADDGPGLRDEGAVKPFASTKPGGLGLGLPVTLKIVSLHGGDLLLAHRSPRGASMTIRLPRSIP